MALRRWVLRPGADDGLVAVYDALLFLMVVVLISVGMFLYSARTIDTTGDVSDAFHQHLADTQLAMVEGLSFNQTHPTPNITIEANATSHKESLIDLTGWVESQTIGWLVENYFWYHFRDVNNTSIRYGLEELVELIGHYFNITVLEGTHFAWSLIMDGQLLVFYSDNATNITELPDDRWVATSDYRKEAAGGDIRMGPLIYYEAELRYYLWYP